MNLQNSGLGNHTFRYDVCCFVCFLKMLDVTALWCYYSNIFYDEGLYNLKKVQNPLH